MKLLEQNRTKAELVLDSGDSLNRARRHRKETNFDALVNMLTEARGKRRKPDAKLWEPLPNSFRKLPSETPEVLRRKVVLKALTKYPLCDVYDLLQCGEPDFARLGNELCITYSDAKRVALDKVQSQLTSIDRAAFWTSVGPRQACVDMGRTLHFTPGKLDNLRPREDMCRDEFEAHSALSRMRLRSGRADPVSVPELQRMRHELDVFQAASPVFAHLPFTQNL